ncbi:hypothetical protein FRC03_011431 [Tulasnella sp. 419]|nr:hypothetical protein FRC03_011431 [Tulasnella sp. 419]
MPPRKSDVAANNIALTTSAHTQQELLMEGIENYELPKALVTRIAKSALPENAKLQKEVVLALNKSSTVFINYLAAAALDIAKSRSHKTIAATDIIKALQIIELQDQVQMLEDELEAYRGGAKKPKVPQKRKPVTDKPKVPTGKGKAKADGGDTSAAASSSSSLNVNKEAMSEDDPAFILDRDSDDEENTAQRQEYSDYDESAMMGEEEEEEEEEGPEEEDDAPAPEDEDRMSVGGASLDERLPREPTPESEAED